MKFPKLSRLSKTAETAFTKQVRAFAHTFWILALTGGFGFWRLFPPSLH